MIFTVYILQSLKDRGLYIGQTNNLELRIQEHNNGLSRSTKSRRPFKLIYSENFYSRSEAMIREKSLKRQKGGDVLKGILNNPHVGGWSSSSSPGS